MATFLDNLTCQPNESELQDLLQQLNQINKRIKMNHIEKQLHEYNYQQYQITLQNKTRPKLWLPSTLRFYFFQYEIEEMRKIVIERELTRYVDKYFVAVRREFNKLRTDWRLQPVEQSSMKSWCRTERKLARNAVSIEPFVVPTTSSTTGRSIWI